MNRKIEVPGGTSLRYSPRIVNTTADFYDTLKRAAEMAVSLPTAGEEQAIYVQKSAGARRLSDVDELMDYFSRECGGWYANARTLTCLRVPERYVGRKYAIGEKIPVRVIVTDITPYLSQIADPLFKRDDWRDIIGNANKVEGELAMPYSRGHVIREVHPTLGIFTDVEQTTEHDAPYALHGWVRENLEFPRDPISGCYDLAINRWSDLLHEDGCLGVFASYGRTWGAGTLDGFRPVVRVQTPRA